MPVPYKKSSAYGIIAEHQFGFAAGHLGCWERHYKITVVVQV
jgi:hypothetical protein